MLLSTLVLALASAVVAVPVATQTIDTRTTDRVGRSFSEQLLSGAGNDGIGQTFTVLQAGGSMLSSFSFFLLQGSPDPAQFFQAYLMAWDPGTRRVTGDFLYQSGSFQENNALPAPAAYTEYRFNTGSLSLTSGQMYAAFLKGTGLYRGYREVESFYDGTKYTGGDLLRVSGRDSNGNPLGESAQAYRDGLSYVDVHRDAAFAASFAAGPVTATPEPATLSLLATGLVGLAGAATRRRAKQPATEA